MRGLAALLILFMAGCGGTGGGPGGSSIVPQAGAQETQFLNITNDPLSVELKNTTNPMEIKLIGTVEPTSFFLTNNISAQNINVPTGKSLVITDILGIGTFSGESIDFFSNDTLVASVPWTPIHKFSSGIVVPSGAVLTVRQNPNCCAGAILKLTILGYYRPI